MSVIKRIQCWSLVLVVSLMPIELGAWNKTGHFVVYGDSLVSAVMTARARKVAISKFLSSGTNPEVAGICKSME
jgi:hypothetical protein